MNRRLLERILKIESATGFTRRMRNKIRRIAVGYGAECFEDQDNLYCVKGQADVYPCVVAHTDTVHDILPDGHYRLGHEAKQDFYYAWNDGTNKQAGVGGDDKVGIFVALSMLEELPACKAAFFRDEEIGCVGSSQARLDFFEDCAFVLQCDRKGNSDFVNKIYGEPMYSDEFAAAIAPILARHGYREAEGMLTDVYELATQGLELSMANMSCGYWGPHTDQEVVMAGDVEVTLSLVREICRAHGHRQWPADRIPMGYATYRSIGWSSEPDWRRDTLLPHCPFCGSNQDVEQSPLDQRLICTNCETYIDVRPECPLCSTAYSMDQIEADMWYCWDCQQLHAADEVLEPVPY